MESKDLNTLRGDALKELERIDRAQQELKGAYLNLTRLRVSAAQNPQDLLKALDLVASW
jgi:hypothetical protein